MPNKPSVFISYRRGSSRDLARLVQTRLKGQGMDVFLDVEDINGGKFSARLEKEIINRDYFLVILKPDTLASEFVRKEIETALRHDKPIIPVEADGFVWPAKLPDDIAGLSAYDGITYSHDYADAAFGRIEGALGLTVTPTSPRTNHRLPLRAILSVLVIILTLLFGFLALFPEDVRTEWFRSLGLLNVALTETAPFENIAITPLPTATGTQGYPCDGTIIFTTGAWLDVVKISPQRNAPSRSRILQGANISILSAQITQGDIWYQIMYNEEIDTGWILNEYVNLSVACPE